MTNLPCLMDDMSNKSHTEDGRPILTTDVQQSILQQAQAAAAAQTGLATPAQHENLLEETDAGTPDVAEAELPPPTYGEVYGEIRDEKNGLGTSAHVTDDGRVDIRINQLNRRLSQIFTPALRQQIETVQDNRPPPPPYIPPSLGGEQSAHPPPPLNVVIQVVGSRGDVQPFVALGKVLKDTYGHRVRLATHPNFKDFVQENGLEFFNIGADPSRLMAFMVKNPSLMPGFRSLMSGDVGQRRKDVAEYIQGCWRSCYMSGDGMDPRAANDELPRNGSGSEHTAKPFVTDCIIANPPSFAHIHCAEKLGIPLHIMFTMPYSPTQAFPHPLANIQSSNADPQLTNYISYAMIEVLSWQGLGEIINRFRVKCLGLDPVSLIWAPGMLQRLKIPHTYCWSPALIPKPKDWGTHISIAGFYSLNLSSTFTPASDLQAFLDAGPPPVYIGFGSIVLNDPNAMTELVFEAVRKTGQRALLSKGWGGMGSTLHKPDDVFMLGDVPHDWLFKHVSCVIHHGGAGTTAAGVTAGRPTLIVPFFGDQAFWGAMIARAGAGPDPIPHKELTADKLADAIQFCLKSETLERAKELASKIVAERGSDVGAQSFHQHLEVDQLRCTLAPSRPAAWRIKRTQVRLSPFAACTLANANLLDFHDLKLFRPKEYNTDEGPWDPISGFAAGLFGAMSSMTMGLTDFPSETWKAVQIPIESSRRRNAMKSETSSVRDMSAPSTLSEQSQMSLDAREHLAHDQRLFNVNASSASNVLQGQSNPKHDDDGRQRALGQSKSGSGKTQDKLRQTGVHTSKGFGRIVKTVVQAPMDLSIDITKGFHNAPKLWGDETVRPQESVRGFKSGAVAAGKEFSFGLYDGVTGLFTQPWKGAQKEGTSGLFKGIGKGIGGFVTKPGAALFGIPSYMMKGVHKEVQKLFGNNVQNYIIASRTAQGYEEWLQSSDIEKQDIVVRWKLIQKYLKKNRNSDEMVQDILEAQRKMSMSDGEARQNLGRTPSSTQSASVSALTLDPEGTRFVTSSSVSFVEPLSPAESNDRLSVPEISREDEEEDPNDEQLSILNVSQVQHQGQEAVDNQTDWQNYHQMIAASEAEAQRRASETSKYEDQLQRAIEQSLREQRRRNGDSSRELDGNFADDTDDKIEPIVSPSASSAHDPLHLAGIIRSEFELQQQEGDKTTQERIEEQIVMEYVKKQSALEAQHQKQGKARAAVTVDEDEEDL